MSCSKDKSIDFLIRKGWVKPSLELTTSLPKEAMLKAIEDMTKVAKTKYDVDMGPLFFTKFRNINVGNYLTMGSASTIVKVRLEPNIAAFEAIDRSPRQEVNQELQKIEDSIGKQVEVDYTAIQTEGNFIINEEGDVIVPPSLPGINIRC